jgi:hypothetical protein
VATLRRQLFESLLEQPVGFFTGHKAGDLLSRLNTDIDGVEDVVTDTVFGLVSNILVTVATLALMFSFSWPLTLAVLVLIPLVELPTRTAGQATYAARGRTQRQRGAMSAHVQEILGISGIMLVKAFGKAPAERERFGRMNRELRAVEVRQNLIAQWFWMLMTTLQNAGPALMILFGGWAGRHRPFHRRYRVRVRHRARRPIGRRGHLPGRDACQHSPARSPCSAGCSPTPTGNLRSPTRPRPWRAPVGVDGRAAGSGANRYGAGPAGRSRISGRGAARVPAVPQLGVANRHSYAAPNPWSVVMPRPRPEAGPHSPPPGRP